MVSCNKNVLREEHRDMEQEQRKMKRASDSQVEQSYLLMPRHINGSGRLFGGQLVAWIDEVAGIVVNAMRSRIL